ITHRRSSQHFAEEKDNQPDSSFFEQLKDRHFKVGFVQRFSTTNFLHVFAKLLISYPKHVIDGHNTEKDILIINHRKRYAVIHFNYLVGCILLIIYVEWNKPVVTNFSIIF